MTSKDTQKRSKSIKLLAELLIKLPERYLNSLESSPTKTHIFNFTYFFYFIFALKTLVDHFVIFLCSKLEDHYTISTAALPGLLNLLHKQQVTYETKSTNEKLGFISEQKSILIVKSVLRDLHVQSMIQSDRHLVFSMCQFVLTSERLIEAIKKENYETDFVYGFIQSMDGEKDPRNLICVIIKKICFYFIRH